MQSRLFRAAAGGAAGGLLAGAAAGLIYWRRAGWDSSMAEVFAPLLVFGPAGGAVAGAFIGFLIERVTVWAGREMPAAARAAAAVGVIFVWSALSSLGDGREDRPLWAELFVPAVVGVPAGLAARPKARELGGESAASGQREVVRSFAGKTR